MAHTAAPPLPTRRQPWSRALVSLADVDECANGAACGEARCQNLPGSYSCLCDEGYAFSSQEKACRGTPPQLPTGPGTNTCEHMCAHMQRPTCTPVNTYTLCSCVCMTTHLHTHHTCVHAMHTYIHRYLLKQLGAFSKLLQTQNLGGTSSQATLLCLGTTDERSLCPGHLPPLPSKRKVGWFQPLSPLQGVPGAPLDPQAKHHVDVVYALSWYRAPTLLQPLH